MELKKCAYCGKENPISGMHEGKLVFRDSKWNGWKEVQFINNKINWYCNDSGCQGYDQMAHEG